VNEGDIMKFEPNRDHPPTLTPEQRARLEAMTDADVAAAALADPDAQPLTEEQLAQFERVPNIKAIRDKLHLSQKQFAETFGLSLSVVRDWEQGRFFPDRHCLKTHRTFPKACDLNNWFTTYAYKCNSNPLGIGGLIW